MVHQTTSFSKFIPSPWWTDTVASRLVQLHKPALGHQTVHLRRKGRRKRGSRSESRRNGRRAHTSQYSSSSPIFIFMNFSEPLSTLRYLRTLERARRVLRLVARLDSSPESLIMSWAAWGFV